MINGPAEPLLGMAHCVRTHRTLGAPGQGWSAAGAACPAADDVACVAAPLASTFGPSSDADPGRPCRWSGGVRAVLGRQSRVRYWFVIDATTLR